MQGFEAPANSWERQILQRESRISIQSARPALPHGAVGGAACRRIQQRRTSRTETRRDTYQRRSITLFVREDATDDSRRESVDVNRRLSADAQQFCSSCASVALPLCRYVRGTAS